MSKHYRAPNFVFGRNKWVPSVSFTLEVEFEFTTWAWVQATAETAFGSGLVVRSPGSVKALNQSTHNSLDHCRNVHSAVASHGRMNFRQWLATAKWTFRQWPRELWVDWFNALIEPGDRTTRPPQNAVSAVAWTQAQVVNSNSTSAVQDPRFQTCTIMWLYLFQMSINTESLQTSDIICFQIHLVRANPLGPQLLNI